MSAESRPAIKTDDLEAEARVLEIELAHGALVDAEEHAVLAADAR